MSGVVCTESPPYRASSNLDLSRFLVLPDKEFRYLRTVIVTAAVYWGLVSMLRRS